MWGTNYWTKEAGVVYYKERLKSCYICPRHFSLIYSRCLLTLSTVVYRLVFFHLIGANLSYLKHKYRASREASAGRNASSLSLPYPLCCILGSINQRWFWGTFFLYSAVQHGSTKTSLLSSVTLRRSGFSIFKPPLNLGGGKEVHGIYLKK